MFHDCIPDRKWRQYCQLAKEKKAIQDPLLKRIENVRTQKVKDENIEYVLDLIEDPDYRDTLVAFLLSGADLLSISTWLHIPLQILEMFCTLCFNQEEFRNKLELRGYAKRYAQQYAQPHNAD